MICKKCGAKNKKGASFCSKCGNTLDQEEKKTTKKKTTKIVEEKEIEKPIEEEVKKPEVNKIEGKTGVDFSNKEDDITITIDKQKYISLWNYIVSGIFKPITTNEETLKDDNTMEEAITRVFKVGVVGMLVNLVMTMIRSVFVKTPTLEGFKTVIDVTGLKDLDYLSLIFKNVIIYLVIMALVACLYFIGSLVVKKEIKMERLLTISANSFIELIATIIFLYQLVSLFSIKLSFVVLALGMILYVLVLTKNISKEIKLNDPNKEILFHICTLGIVLLIVMQSVESAFSAYLNGFIS